MWNVKSRLIKIARLLRFTSDHLTVDLRGWFCCFGNDCFSNGCFSNDCLYYPSNSPNIQYSAHDAETSHVQSKRTRDTFYRVIAADLINDPEIQKAFCDIFVNNVYILTMFSQWFVEYGHQSKYNAQYVAMVTTVLDSVLPSINNQVCKLYLLSIMYISLFGHTGKHSNY